MQKIKKFYHEVNYVHLALIDLGIIVLLVEASLEHGLTHLSLASLLWDIFKQNSPRCDAAERGVPSGAILFA